MRQLIIVAAMAASVTAATTGGYARAAMIPNAGIATAASEAILIQKTQYVWGGRNYCWYGNGWRGPGWYWCGYASSELWLGRRPWLEWLGLAGRWLARGWLARRRLARGWLARWRTSLPVTGRDVRAVAQSPAALACCVVIAVF